MDSSTWMLMVKAGTVWSLLLLMIVAMVAIASRMNRRIYRR